MLEASLTLHFMDDVRHSKLVLLFGMARDRRITNAVGRCAEVRSGQCRREINAVGQSPRARSQEKSRRRYLRQVASRQDLCDSILAESVEFRVTVRRNVESILCSMLPVYPAFLCHVSYPVASAVLPLDVQELQIRNRGSM